MARNAQAVDIQDQFGLALAAVDRKLFSFCLRSCAHHRVPIAAPVIHKSACCDYYTTFFIALQQFPSILFCFSRFYRWFQVQIIKALFNFLRFLEG